jgi:hypothetical protein
MLSVMTIRRRWPEGAAVLIWFAVPMFLISFGTSKLYHYTYPFLPPLAVAGGYAAALALMLAPAPVARALEPPPAGSRPRGIAAALRQPAMRIPLAVIGLVAAGLAVASLAYGEVQLNVGGRTLIRNSALIRPMLIAALCGVLIVRPRNLARTVVMLSVAALLPLSSYLDAISHLNDEHHPLRSARDCLLAAEGRERAPGLYVYVPDQHLPHAVYYYFRQVQPWTRASVWDPQAAAKTLADSSMPQPALVWGLHTAETAADSSWDAAQARAKISSMPSADLGGDIRLVLPPPYAACATSTSLSGPSL